MNRFVSLCLILVALVASSVQGFAPSNLGGISGGKSPLFDVRICIHVMCHRYQKMLIFLHLS